MTVAASTRAYGRRAPQNFCRRQCYRLGTPATAHPLRAVRSLSLVYACGPIYPPRRMGDSVEPSGIVTLLTDFGINDPFVGVMKGVVLSRFRAAQLVDLAHGVSPQDVREGSFWLARSVPWFPPGTVHVAVVDPGVGSERRALAARCDDQIVLAPDNGLLSGVVARSARSAVHVIEPARFDLPPLSSTFHGRDLFAPVAAELASGRRGLDAVGPMQMAPAPPSVVPPRQTDGAVEGTVVVVDRFGNLITDIDAAMVGPLGQVQVRIADRLLELRRTYADARSGELVALINAFGTVEVARRDGDASRTLGLGRGQAVRVQKAAKPS